MAEATGRESWSALRDRRAAKFACEPDPERHLDGFLDFFRDELAGRLRAR